MLAGTDNSGRSVRNVVGIYRHELGKNQERIEKTNERYMGKYRNNIKKIQQFENS